MKILYFYPRWGSEHIPWETFLDTVVNAGFDGVEISAPESDEDARTVMKMINERDLQLILQHYETETADFEEHRTQFNKRIKRLASLNPNFINSHTGKEHFSFEQNDQLLKDMLELEKESNIAISHETHRGRFSYAPSVLAKYLDQNDIKLTLDISHWFCVTESLLQAYEAIIKQCLGHVQHIHARFGHPQGPQLENLTDPINREIIYRHFEIWDKVIKYHQDLGKDLLYVTTEVGPWPYMRSEQAKSRTWKKQWSENCKIMQLFKDRYGN